MQFDNTHIYRRALELVDLSKEVLDQLPYGYGFLADQLRRATTSIPLNFCEGYGKGTLKDQQRFYDMARGSTCEVAAILDAGYHLGVVAQTHQENGRELCDHLARMLSRFRR